MVNLGNSIILFGDSDCPACLYQMRVLNDYYNERNERVDILYFNLNVNNAPEFLMDSNGDYSMPTWYLPASDKLHSGIIEPKKFDNELNKFGKKKNNKNNKNNRFGATETSGIPQMGTLKEYGKNAIGDFNIPDSWHNNVSKNWKGDILNSGTVGRELGPGNTDKIYSSEYLNTIRMLRPGDDLDTALNTNRNCNQLSIMNTKTMGIVTDTENQQTVPMNNFGLKKKNRFGLNLGVNASKAYSQDKNITPYGGGSNKTPKEFSPKQNMFLYKDYKKYNPIIKSNIMNNTNNFGNKKKPIGEGTVISLKNRKIKYS